MSVHADENADATVSDRAPLFLELLGNDRPIASQDRSDRSDPLFYSLDPNRPDCSDLTSPPQSKPHSRHPPENSMNATPSKTVR